MAKFAAFLLSESKQFLRIWNVLAWIVLLAVTLFFGNKHVCEIKAASGKESRFIQIQNNQFKTTPNWEGYGRDGIKSMYLASPVAFLFTNTIIPPDLTAKVDNTVCLNISNNIKSKSLSPGNLIYGMDFSGIVLFVLFFMAVFYGFDSMQNKKHLKFLSGFIPNKKLFFPLVISRFLILVLAFLLLFAAQFIPLEIHGLDLSSADYSGLLDFLVAALLLMAFFFSSGLIMGNLKLKSRIAGFLIFTVWFGFIFVIPEIIISTTDEKIPDAIEGYQTELKKFEAMIDYEIQCEKKYGKFDRGNIEQERKLAEEYWNNYYKKVIEPMEEELKNKFYTAVDRFQKRAVWFPTSFYMVTCNEVSSRGYGSFFDYYDFIRALKAKFVRFWINRVFYEDRKVMVNFLDQENVIFRAESKRHPYFGTGVLVTLGFIIILLSAASLLYRRSLLPAAKNTSAFDNVSMPLARNKIINIFSSKQEFTGQFVIAFFNESKLFKGKIKIDGKDITVEDREGVLCLSHPSHIRDDITAGNLLALLKKLLRLTGEEYRELKSKAGSHHLKKLFSVLELGDKANIMLSAAELGKWQTLILDDFSLGLPSDIRSELAERIQKLKKQGVMILDIVSDGCQWLETDISLVTRYKDGRYTVKVV